jgi:hypothetical protein
MYCRKLPDAIDRIVVGQHECRNDSACTFSSGLV